MSSREHRVLATRTVQERSTPSLRTLRRLILRWTMKSNSRDLKTALKSPKTRRVAVLLSETKKILAMKQMMMTTK